MPITEWKTTDKSKQAKAKLEKIKKQLLTNFLERDLEILRKKTTVDQIIDYAKNKGGNIHKYAECLDDDDNMKDFQQAIELLSKDMTETKREGLFYKCIVKNKDKLPESKSEIEKFLESTGDKDSVGESGKGTRNAIRKLKSDRLSSVLKAFIALVAWDYIAIKEETDEQQKRERMEAEKAKATSEAHKSKAEEVVNLSLQEFEDDRLPSPIPGDYGFETDFPLYPMPGSPRNSNPIETNREPKAQVTKSFPRKFEDDSEDEDFSVHPIASHNPAETNREPKAQVIKSFPRKFEDDLEDEDFLVHPIARSLPDLDADGEEYNVTTEPYTYDEMDGCIAYDLYSLCERISENKVASDAPPISTTEFSKKLSTLKQKNDTLKKRWKKIRPFLTPELFNTSLESIENPLAEKLNKDPVVDRLFGLIDKKIDEWSELLGKATSGTVKLPGDIKPINDAQSCLETLIKNREERKRLDIEKQNARLEKEAEERKRSAPQRLAKKLESKRVFEKLDELAKSDVELDFEKSIEESELPPQVASSSYHQYRLVRKLFSNGYGFNDLSDAKINGVDKEALKRLFLQNGRCSNGNSTRPKIRESDLQYFFNSQEIDKIVGDCEIGKYFTIEGYITCRKFDSKYMEKFGERVYSVKIIPQAHVIINEELHGHFAVIPPNTKFKITGQKDSEKNGVKIKIIELEIASQTFPKTDEAHNSEELKKLSDDIAKKQNEVWKSLAEIPKNGQLPQKDDSTGWGITGYDSYLYLLAEKQRPYLLQDEAEAESHYTSDYNYTDKIKKSLNDIFEDIEPLGKPITVFRAMDINEMDAIVEHYYEKGNAGSFEYTDDLDNHLSGFLSTSINPLIAIDYQRRSATVKKGDGMLKLTIPAEKKAIVPEATSDAIMTANREILLQRKNLRININKITKVKMIENYYYLIEATVVV